MPYFYPYNSPYQSPAPAANMQPLNAGIPGRVVNTFQEVTIGDIPTNGSVAFFIKSDLSEIQTRKWSDDGRVLVGSFRPENPQPVNLPTDSAKAQEGAPALATADILKRLDEIDARLDQIITKPTPTKAKKENENI